MSNLALKILAEFRSLPAVEQEEVAAAVTAEVRGADAAGRLRVLDEITSKYRSEEPAPGNLDDAWAEGILPSKRTA